MHTPGPWKAIKRGVNEEHVILPEERHRSAESWYIASTTGNVPEDASNARLIAAAPELLAACKQVIAALSQPATYPADLALIRATCAAAIHAATHQEPTP